MLLQLPKKRTKILGPSAANGHLRGRTTLSFPGTPRALLWDSYGLRCIEQETCESRRAFVFEPRHSSSSKRN
jgi:hypothetical protein